MRTSSPSDSPCPTGSRPTGAPASWCSAPWRAAGCHSKWPGTRSTGSRSRSTSWWGARCMRPSTTYCCRRERAPGVWSTPRWCEAGSTRSGGRAPKTGAAAALSVAAGCISASSRCWPSSSGSGTTICRGEPMLITFSGLDGAGKSTLVRWLQQTLERENRRVVVFHMNDHVGVYAYLRLLRNQLGGAPPRNGGGALHRVRNALLWGKLLRRAIYPLDLLLFLAYRLYHEYIRRRVVIMDRYFYDTLVDVADGRHWAVLRLLQWLTPTPDLAVLLDVGPEESYARKRDYPVEYLRSRWLVYHTVFPWVRGALVIKNDDLHTAQQAVAHLVGERLAA